LLFADLDLLRLGNHSELALARDRVRGAARECEGECGGRKQVTHRTLLSSCDQSIANSNGRLPARSDTQYRKRPTR
jgi:hypothetical protein